MTTQQQRKVLNFTHNRFALFLCFRCKNSSAEAHDNNSVLSVVWFVCHFFSHFVFVFMWRRHFIISSMSFCVALFSLCFVHCYVYFLLFCADCRYKKRETFSAPKTTKSSVNFVAIAVKSFHFCALVL